MSCPEVSKEFESLLNYIKKVRGFDFTGYKRSSLTRRVRKRMQAQGIEKFTEYQDYLEVHPQEFIELFNTILINVTGFFRDPDTWDYIREEIIPRIAKSPDQPIRVWSAGCASGQEAYTLAMVLAESLGISAFKQRVKIYATDLDEQALNQARHGIYSASEVSNIPPELLERYFQCNENSYVFRKDLRRSVIFGRHNLVQDAPISRIDFLVCRNTLMYFNAEAQGKIIARYHFALNDNGFLLLGKAEMLLNHGNSFIPIDLKRKIFSRCSGGVPRNRQPLTEAWEEGERSDYLNRQFHLRDEAFDSSPVAQLVVEREGTLFLINERARELFGLTSQDLNRPLQDLELSYRPLELRSCIEQSYQEKRTITIRDFEWAMDNNESLFFNVSILPLVDVGGTVLGALIVFSDVTRAKQLQKELEHANQEIEIAYEELQSTNEELETTNEELQSSNEELETTNEELQSTNEELETMNEELQSSNDELQSLNDELQTRTEELNSVNSFLASILASLQSGVVVVDRELRVLVWNEKAEDLWGVRLAETRNQYLLNLDIGLPVEQLLQPLRTCLLAGAFETVEITLPSVNRRGRSLDCRVACTPLLDLSGEIQGAILFMDGTEKADGL
ncbi:MAG: hypothetical protein N5P05_001664 [Chroococcopsis gigantea SAG 12.99]|jgi:two-component system CheB/CheR fusion protein|nr:hypothetical protein [Chroococcopsis gigantea SAG 12.99]